MRDILDAVHRQWSEGGVAALATVVHTFDSAPRAAGTAMLVTTTGGVVGSVSGGCVEGAVYELAQQVMSDGHPVLVRFGISDDDAFAVGLTCGGIIDIFVETISQASFTELGSVAVDIEAGRPVGVATVVEHPDSRRLGRHLVVRADGTTGDLGCDRANQAVGDDTLGLLAAGRNEVLTYGPDGERRGAGMRVFFSSFAPKPRLLVFGATDFAAALARQGAFIGYRVTVCDARPVFATPERFPDAHEVVVAWPHRYLAEQKAAGLLDERTAMCVLTHDPKFDVPLLDLALRDEKLAYVGAMGSRRTHDDRRRRLQDAGLSEEQLARLHSPIGLDLGARTPEETAVSIAAEIIASQWGGSGLPLTTLADRIHAPAACVAPDRAEVSAARP